MSAASDEDDMRAQTKYVTEMKDRVSVISTKKKYTYQRLPFWNCEEVQCRK